MTERLTVEQLREQKRVSLHNSNALNVASALDLIEDSIAELEHKLYWFNVNKKRLEEFALNGDMTDTSRVQELYDWKCPPYKKKAW